MKRNTAFNLAIEVLKEKQVRNYHFSYRAHQEFLKVGYINEPTRNAYKEYLRIDEAIKWLETERDNKQMDLFEGTEVVV